MNLNINHGMDINLMDKTLENIDDIYKVMVTHSPNTIAILSLERQIKLVVKQYTI